MHTTTASHLPLAQASFTRFAPLSSKTLRSMALAGCMALAFLSPATAADFTGSLKGVSITDAQATNKAPVAAFTYSQNGDIITLDASGSSDPDGSITKYKWSFSNGITAEGATTNYTVTDSTKFQVTLTVVDNNNGAALNQQTIIPVSKDIADDFSTDTSANYTMLAGGLKIYDGFAHASNAWTAIYAFHNKELPSSDHTIEADVYTDGTNGSGGVIFRANKIQNTGYIAWFSNGNIILSSYSAGTKNWLASFSGKYTAGIHHLKAEISGNAIKLYVDGSLALQATNSTFITGKFVGLHILPNGNEKSITTDNLIAR